MRSLGLSEPLYRYVVEHSGPEHPVLRELREATAGMKHAGMQIGVDQGKLMALLVKLIGARRTLEIGVFTGYSALAVALALPPDGRVVACDVSEEWTAVGRAHWQKAGVADRIDLRLGRATKTLDGLLAGGESGRFDFAFIDADKESYGAYYERCLQLVRAGGLIAIDNTLWSGAVADPAKRDADTDAIRALNDAIHRDERVDAAMLTVGDGLTLARRR
ncbi:MAG TPA: class I SAM-dependent methyltransferase [Usitatibacter sp.]|jgi:predicted O-methyltransferase YrrM|nr:class I SAM-dependent methyltransferase [Usitatibacter sp.]